MTKCCGFVVMLGRPNVGKSTLLNAMVGCQLSITSSKPQTTRQRILGIDTQENHQIIYVDTPGLHKTEKKYINQTMNRNARHALEGVDVVVFVIEAGRWTEADEWALACAKPHGLPVILAINKIDRLHQYNLLFPFVAKCAKKHDFHSIVPVSAKFKRQLDGLSEEVISCLPESDGYLFPEGQLTDRDDFFMVCEMVREQAMRLLGEELPYATTVSIEHYKKTQRLLDVAVVIWVERAGQKAIMIGRQGEMLKRMGTGARLSIERYFNQKVFLKIWVKVKPGWTNDPKSLHQFGLDH